MATKQGYLPTLDGWRAIAITAVTLDHVVAFRFGTAHPILFALTRTGPNGVSLFFAISGFLICSRLLEEEDATGKINLGGFYIRRASRILPAALTYLVVIGLLGIAGFILVSPWEWWSAVFFFRNYLSPGLISRGWGGYTIHYWSLAVEEHFYLLWPGLLVLAGRKRSQYVAVALAVAVSIWRWWDFNHHWMDKHIPGLLIGSRTDVRLDGLLIGCLAALLLAKPRFRSWAIWNLGWPAWFLCAAIYVGIQVIARRHYYSVWESILLAAIIVSTVLHPGTWIGRVLEWSGMRWIGRLSYSLYLWQELFTVPQAKYPISLLQRFPFNLVLLFAAAALSYRFIERPMIRLGHRLAPPPTPGRQDAGTTLRAGHGGRNAL
jgi:peptidoglycan/LPS O-acetylase OafA/YrhL